MHNPSISGGFTNHFLSCTAITISRLFFSSCLEFDPIRSMTQIRGEWRKRAKRESETARERE